MTTKTDNKNEPQTPEAYLKATFEESLMIKKAFFDENAAALIQGARLIGESIRGGGKLLILGNGGSAADGRSDAH